MMKGFLLGKHAKKLLASFIAFVMVFATVPGIPLSVFGAYDTIQTVYNEKTIWEGTSSAIGNGSGQSVGANVDEILGWMQPGTVFTVYYEYTSPTGVEKPQIGLGFNVLRGNPWGVNPGALMSTYNTGTEGNSDRSATGFTHDRTEALTGYSAGQFQVTYEAMLYRFTQGVGNQASTGVDLKGNAHVLSNLQAHTGSNDNWGSTTEERANNRVVFKKVTIGMLNNTDTPPWDGGTIPTPVASSVAVTMRNASADTAADDYRNWPTLTTLADIEPGSVIELRAVVSGTNNPSHDVTWSVDGTDSAIEKNTGTTRYKGNRYFLTVGADETADELTVTATTKDGSAVSGTATVGVAQESAAPRLTGVDLQTPVYNETDFNLTGKKTSGFDQYDTTDLNVLIVDGENKPFNNIWFTDDTIITFYYGYVDPGNAIYPGNNIIGPGLATNANSSVRLDYSTNLADNATKSIVDTANRTIQSKYEAFRDSSRTATHIENGYKHPLIFAGGIDADVSNFIVERVTIGTVNDVAFAPWEAGYVPPTATVTGVTVSPATANVVKDGTSQFGATVTGENNPAQDVTWTVEGSVGNVSTITAGGLLTVGAGETATELTVKATSVADTTKSGTAAVTVVDVITWPAAPIPVRNQKDVAVNDTRNGPVESGKNTISGSTGSGDNTNYFKADYMADGTQFQKAWFVPGVVLTFYYSSPKTINWNNESFRVAQIQATTPNNGWVNPMGNTSTNVANRNTNVIGNDTTKIFQYTYEVLKTTMDSPSKTPAGTTWTSGWTTIALWPRNTNVVPITFERVTFGVAEDTYAYAKAPWEDGFTPISVTGITIDAPSDSLLGNAAHQFGITATGTSEPVLAGKEAHDPMKKVKWEITSTDHHTGTTISQNGLLKIDLNETQTSITVKATSDFNSAATATKTIAVVMASDDKAIESYKDIDFRVYDWGVSNLSTTAHRYTAWGQLEGGYANNTSYYGTYVSTVPMATVYDPIKTSGTTPVYGGALNTNLFRKEWFTPDTVLTIYFNKNGGVTEADLMAKLKLGMELNGESSVSTPASVPVTIAVSTNPADKATKAILDFAKGTIQATHAAFVANGYNPAWSNDKNTDNFWRFAAFLGADLTAGSITVTKTTLGVTGQDIIPLWRPWVPENMPLTINAAKPAPSPATLPEGRTGLASKYELDDGLKADAAVIRYSDFKETTTGRVTDLSDINPTNDPKGWNGLRLQTSAAYMYIVEQGETTMSGANKSSWTGGHGTNGVGNGDGKTAEGAANIPGGADAKAAVLWTDKIPSQGNMSIELQNYLGFGEEQDTLFIRSYHYWAPQHAITGSSHNGMTLSALDRRVLNGSTGTPDSQMVNGYEFFNTMLEFTQFTAPPKDARTPGRAAVYIYYPEHYNVPYGDHFFPNGDWTPNGSGYRPKDSANFTVRPDHYPSNGQWYCYEFMVQANTIVDGVIQRDGRIAAWIDGELIYDFPNIILRYTEELKINVNRVLLINSGNPEGYGYETYKMVTGFVMATEYIGPMSLPADVELDSIAIASPASKLTYEVGEKLNLAGLDVTANYLDSGNNPSSDKATGFTTTPANNYTFVEGDIGTFPVTISFTEGAVTKTTSFDVTVTAKKPAAYREVDLKINSTSSFTINAGWSGDVRLGAERVTGSRTTTFTIDNPQPVADGILDTSWIKPGTVFTIYYETESTNPQSQLGSGLGFGPYLLTGNTIRTGSPNNGPGLLTGANGAVYKQDYMQVTYANILNRYLNDANFEANIPFFDYLYVTSTANLGVDVKITKITIGMVDDVTAPWEEAAALESIAITTPPADHYAGESLDLTGMVVTATYSDGSTKPVTGYTTGALSGSNAATAPVLNITGVNNKVVVSYTEEGVTKTADLDFAVRGQRVYKEKEFDLTGRLTTYPNSFYYTILDKMVGGETFDKSWFTDGTIITVYYDTTGASANGDLRLAVLSNMVNKDPATYNPTSGAGNTGNQFRIQSTYDIREVPYAVATVGRGLAFMNGAAGTARTGDTLQGTYEVFWNERTTRTFLVDDSYDYLSVFSGSASLYNNFTITKITIGVTDPTALAPWEDGYAKPQPTSVTITAPASMDRGTSAELDAVVAGPQFVGQGVIWEVRNSANSTISTVGALSVASYETESALTIRATSLVNSAVYDEVTIAINTADSTLKIPAYAEIRFNFENRTTALSSVGNASNGAAISRSTLINNSTAFNKDWFRPGAVVTFYYTASGTVNDANAMAALTMGLSRKAANIGGSNTAAQLPNTSVSANAADSATKAIVDTTARTVEVYLDTGSSGGTVSNVTNVRTIQVTYEAFIAAGGNLKTLTENLDFEGITAVLTGTQMGTVTIRQATLGWTDKDSPAPWQTETRRNPNPAFNRTKADPGPLPTGYGISKNYLYDAGIDGDSSVVFADDFSTYAEGRVLGQADVNKWTSVRLQTNYANMFIVNKGTTSLTSKIASSGVADPAREITFDGTDDMPGDAAAVLWTNSPIGAGNFSIELQKYLEDDEALDTVFIRYYQYFAPNFAINGSSHNGVTMSWADRQITNGQWGSNGLMIANGYDFFNVMNEYWRADGTPSSIKSPGQANIYIYYPGQTTSDYGDHFNANGNGTKPAQFLGLPHFTVRNDFWPENGKWYCYEMMVQMNSVIGGVVQDDGRIASWVDGELIMDFPNLELRYTEELKMNISRALLINSPNSTPGDAETYKMIANYVMATEYIGPMYAPLSDIAVTTQPVKTQYNAGEALDLSGMVVTASYENGTSMAVTAYTTSPANGAVLNTVGNQDITVSYTEDGVTKTAVITVAVTAPASYAITLVSNPANAGTQTASAASAVSGTLVTLSATANSGYTFTGWSSNDVTITDDEFIMPGKAVEITANYTSTGSGNDIPVVVSPSVPTPAPTPAPTDEPSVPVETPAPKPVITDENGNELTPDENGIITVPEDGAVTITVPDATIAVGGGATITQNEEGLVIGGAATVQTGGAEITLPNGGTLTGAETLIVGNGGATVTYAVGLTFSFDEGEMLILDEDIPLGFIRQNAGFNDVQSGAWYSSSVLAMQTLGLFAGTSEGIFSPNMPMTRSMFVTVLHRMAGRPAAEEINAFTDIPANAYYSVGAAWAKEIGITSGIGAGLFGPDINITREQLVTMLVSFARSLGIDTTTNKALTFVDADAIAPWAVDAVCWAQANGIVFGKTGNVFDPKSAASRAEVAAVLERFLEMK